MTSKAYVVVWTEGGSFGAHSVYTSKDLADDVVSLLSEFFEVRYWVEECELHE